MSLAAGDPWAYRPPLSLWQLVEQNVSHGEQEEIRSMLGTSLIETTLDLHNEVEMLLEIWRDYQDETESEQHQTRTLAEPPHVRDRLVQEICFLAEGVREKSQRKGMNPSALLAGHKSHILEYAEEAKRSGSSLGTARPMSAMSCDGRQTPLSPSDQANSRLVLSNTIDEDIASTSDKLNYLHFDEVCARLRETLSKEAEQLETDVVFLHQCLDSAADVRSGGGGGSPALSREPTLTELREERSMLEKELLSSDNLPTTPSVSRPKFFAKSSSANMRMQNLSPINPRLRPAPRSDDKGSGKTSTPLKPTPLKASHQITPGSASTRSDSGSASPSGSMTPPRESPSPSNQNTNSRIIAHHYDLTVGGDDQSPNPQERDLNRVQGSDDIRRREGSGGSHRRLRSPARVKVVPVGSILGSHVDSVEGGPFIPTPPPPCAEKPQLPRPSSADRFRKMIMNYREAT